jgi:hypothetical protein
MPIRWLRPLEWRQHWLIAPQRLGPLIRTLLLIHNEQIKLGAAFANSVASALAATGFAVPVLGLAVQPFDPLNPRWQAAGIGIFLAWVGAFWAHWWVHRLLRKLREPDARTAPQQTA